MLEISSVLTAGGVHLPPALTWNTLQTHLLDTVDGICNCVPYLLGEVDEAGSLHVGSNGKPIVALFALWPLHAAALVQGTDEACFNWILEQLQRVGYIAGMQEAVALEKHHLLRQPSVMGLESLSAFQFEV